MARPLKSANVKTSNILLKVTVPKRTGLKRRKGSLGPYHEVLDQDDFPASERRRKAMTKEAQYFFRSLSDNDQGYEIAAVGVIGQTHRFRGNLH